MDIYKSSIIQILIIIFVIIITLFKIVSLINSEHKYYFQCNVESQQVNCSQVYQKDNSLYGICEEGYSLEITDFTIKRVGE